MATVTNWIEHLTTDVDTATEGVQVAGSVYPHVGSELLLVLVGIIFWLVWTFYTAAGEEEEQGKLARKRHGTNDYKNNITEW